MGLPQTAESITWNTISKWNGSCDLAVLRTSCFRYFQKGLLLHSRLIWASVIHNIICSQNCVPYFASGFTDSEEGNSHLVSMQACWRGHSHSRKEALWSHFPLSLCFLKVERPSEALWNKQFCLLFLLKALLIAWFFLFLFPVWKLPTSPLQPQWGLVKLPGELLPTLKMKPSVSAGQAAILPSLSPWHILLELTIWLVLVVWVFSLHWCLHIV